VNSTTTLDEVPPQRSSFDWLMWLPAVLVTGWLVWDLQYWWQTQEDYNFGWFVPLLVGYLIYDNWDAVSRPGVPDRRWYVPVWAGAALLLAVVEVGRETLEKTPTLSWLLAFAAVGGVAATILATRGRECLRQCRFPLLFALVAVPIPFGWWHALGQVLQRFVALVNSELLNLMNIAAAPQGNIVQMACGPVGIDEACSGIRSLQSSFMVALLLGKLMLHSYRFRFLLLLLGPVIVVPGNIVRTMILCLTAHYKGIDAMHEIHDAAGWSILAVTLVGQLVTVWWLRRCEREQAEDASVTPRLAEVP
jgi:exosortase